MMKDDILIKCLFGRCKDFDKNCVSCRAWKNKDLLGYTYRQGEIDERDRIIKLVEDMLSARRRIISKDELLTKIKEMPK